MSLPKTQKRDQRRRQTAEQRKARRKCYHDWELICYYESIAGPHRKAMKAGWNRYCRHCDSYSR